MASVQQIAERREKAIGRINAVTDGLRRQAGVNVDQQPVSAKDPELAAVMHLENAAAVLEAMGGQIGLKRSDGGNTGVPENHRSHHIAPFVNEYIAPRETPQQASQRQTQQTQRAGEEVRELGRDETAAGMAAASANPSAADTAPAPPTDDDTDADQSDEAKARRAHRAEHRTSKK